MVKRDICCKDSMLITKEGIRHVELASHCKKKSQSFRSYFQSYFVPFPYQPCTHWMVSMKESNKTSLLIFQNAVLPLHCRTHFKKPYVCCLFGSAYIVIRSICSWCVCVFFWNFLRKQHNSPKKCNIVPILWFM